MVDITIVDGVYKPTFTSLGGTILYQKTTYLGKSTLWVEGFEKSVTNFHEVTKQ